MNVNSALPKIDQLFFISKQSNYSIIRVSEPKLHVSILNGEVDIMSSDRIRMNQPKRGSRVSCYVKKLLYYNHKSSFFPNIKSIFMDVLLPKSKQILVGVLHWPPEKPGFIDYRIIDL